MKKLLAILMVMVFVLSMSTVAFAEEISHEVETSVTATQTMQVVYVGDEISLQAVTPKHGSSVDEETWVITDEEDNIVAPEDASVTESVRTLEYVDGVNSYVSRTTFSADKPGTYTVTYTIVMRAGKSEVTFHATDSKDIRVIAERSLIGVEIRNITWAQEGKNLKGTGTVWLVYDNGDKEPTNLSQNVTFGAGEIKNGTMTKDVTVNIDGVEYTTSVTRP